MVRVIEFYCLVEEDEDGGCTFEIHLLTTTYKGLVLIPGGAVYKFAPYPELPTARSA